MADFIPGPWRWELNKSSLTVELCGGGVRPGTFDWRVMSFRRWGMSGAQPEFWTWNGNVGDPHKVVDLAKALPGREHHAHWFAEIDHPDARLIAAAPDLYTALDNCVTNWKALGGHAVDWLHEAMAALEKARGPAKTLFEDKS